MLIALGETERARNADDELQGVVAEVGSDSLRASALAVEGIVPRRPKVTSIRRARASRTPSTCSTSAVTDLRRRGRGFDLAGAVLATLGRTGPAAEQARVAHEALAGMQAEREAQRASALLSELGDPAAAEATSVLTARELDVLKLVARGLSNTEIAQRLFLSEHTVHRHLANILRKPISHHAPPPRPGARARASSDGRGPSGH